MVFNREETILVISRIRIHAYKRAKVSGNGRPELGHESLDCCEVAQDDTLQQCGAVCMVWCAEVVERGKGRKGLQAREVRQHNRRVDVVLLSDKEEKVKTNERTRVKRGNLT